MLDQELAQTTVEANKKRQKGILTPIECEMLITVARTKCYDRIYEQEGVEENDIVRCSAAYKI